MSTLKTTTKPREAGKPGVLSRAQVVLLSLAGALTAVGGLLLVLTGGPADFQGNTVPQLTQTAAPAGSGRAIDAVFNTAEPVKQGQWNYIVIHHSGTPTGSADDLAARDQNRGIKGLGQHFVIGNGQGSADGLIEQGWRWDAQLAGAHTEGPQAGDYNLRGIGVCLVGNGERRPFTQAQFDASVELVAALLARLDLPVEAVVLHRDVAPTGAPGRLFPEAMFRDRVAAALAAN